MSVSLPTNRIVVVVIAVMLLAYTTVLLRLGDKKTQDCSPPASKPCDTCALCNPCECPPPVTEHTEPTSDKTIPPPPKARVTVVTTGWYSNEIEPVKHLHEINKKVYTGYHGYKLAFIPPETFTKQPKLYGRNHIFGKLDGILDNMKDCDYLMWMDVDTIITNMTVKIEDLAKKHLGETKDFAIQWPLTDLKFMPNAGVLLMKCSDWSVRMLKAALEVKEVYNKWAYEQQALNVITKSEPWKERVNYVVGDHDFNTLCGYHPPSQYCRWKPGDFLVHFAPASGMESIPLISKYFYETIDSWFKK